MQNVIVNTFIYVYPYIYFRINLPNNNLNPQLNTYHIHMQARIHSRTKANSSLTACSPLAVIHSSSYLGVEAVDPYITIQVNGIHTIARRMDDKVKTPVLVLK